MSSIRRTKDVWSFWRIMLTTRPECLMGWFCWCVSGTDRKGNIMWVQGCGRDIEDLSSWSKYFRGFWDRSVLFLNFHSFLVLFSLHPTQHRWDTDICDGPYRIVCNLENSRQRVCNCRQNWGAQLFYNNCTALLIYFSYWKTAISHPTLSTPPQSTLPAQYPHLWWYYPGSEVLPPWIIYK